MTQTTYVASGYILDGFCLVQLFQVTTGVTEGIQHLAPNRGVTMRRRPPKEPDAALPQSRESRNGPAPRHHDAEGRGQGPSETGGLPITRCRPETTG